MPKKQKSVSSEKKTRRKKKAVPLTDKQKAFCLEYARDANATQAVVRAGYAPKTAAVMGHKLLKKGNISAQVRRLRKNISEIVEMTSEWVVEELRRNHIDARKKKDFAGSNRALELIGKSLGTFDDKGAEDPNVTIIVKTYVPGPPGSLVGKKKKP